MRRPQAAAALAVAAFLALTVVMDWVPNPLNPNIAHTTAAERLPGTLIHLCVGVAVIAANLSRRRVPILLGAVWYSVVLTAAILNWWLPYLTGTTVGEVDATTIQEYAGNPRVLPEITGRPIVPDVQHLLIHASILAAVVLGWASFRSTPARARPRRLPAGSRR